MAVQIIKNVIDFAKWPSVVIKPLKRNILIKIKRVTNSIIMNYKSSDARKQVYFVQTSKNVTS